MDTVFTGSSDPLLVGVEADLVDGGTGVEGSVFFLQVGEFPDLKDIFTTTSGDVDTSGGNGKGVDVVLVCSEAVLNQEVGLPDLQSSVPTSGGEVGVAFIGGVSDGGNPVGVVVLFIGVLAISEGVPELEGSVGTR